MADIVEHARHELTLCGQAEEDPAYTAALIAAIAAFNSYRHSGGSAWAARQQLMALLDWDTLSPLTSNPTEWEDRSGMSGYPLWQNVRNPRAFSQDGGKSHWLLPPDGILRDSGNLPTDPRPTDPDDGASTRTILHSPNLRRVFQAPQTGGTMPPYRPGSDEAPTLLDDDFAALADESALTRAEVVGVIEAARTRQPALIITPAALGSLLAAAEFGLHLGAQRPERQPDPEADPDQDTAFTPVNASVMARLARHFAKDSDPCPQHGTWCDVSQAFRVAQVDTFEETSAALLDNILTAMRQCVTLMSSGPATTLLRAVADAALTALTREHAAAPFEADESDLLQQMASYLKARLMRGAEAGNEEAESTATALMAFLGANCVH